MFSAIKISLRFALTSPCKARKRNFTKNSSTPLSTIIATRSLYEKKCQIAESVFFSRESVDKQSNINGKYRSRLGDAAATSAFLAVNNRIAALKQNGWQIQADADQRQLCCNSDFPNALYLALQPRFRYSRLPFSPRQRGGEIDSQHVSAVKETL